MRNAIERIGAESLRAASAVKKLRVSLDFAAKSAKAFAVAWLDGKWVATGSSSSKRKMGAGGKR
jgi:hypothetical protein